MLAFTLTVLVVCKSMAGADKPLEGVASIPPASQPPAKHLQFNLVLFEGNPLESRDAGTVKVLAELHLVTEASHETFEASAALSLESGLLHIQGEKKQQDKQREALEIFRKQIYPDNGLLLIQGKEKLNDKQREALEILKEQICPHGGLLLIQDKEKPAIK